jgi:hypothetical protein
MVMLLMLALAGWFRFDFRSDESKVCAMSSVEVSSEGAAGTPPGEELLR